MKIKRYIFSLLLVSFSSFSMDKALSLKNNVTLIGERIEQEILNRDEKPSFVGCCLNFTTSFSSIPKSKAITDLREIESIIQQTNHIQPHNEIIKKLYQEHFYFARLINVMVQDEVEQLSNVTSITLDTLCDTQTKIANISSEISAFIREKSHDYYQKKYLNHNSFDREFYSLGEEEIHVMPLKKDNHVPCRLAICDKGKYLKSFDGFDNAVIWDIEEGKEVDKIPSDVLINRNTCCNNHDHKFISDNRLVTCGYAAYPYRSSRLYEYYKKYKILPAMVVIQPTVISWLCQQVFLKNKQNESALIKLRDSQSVAKIEGFPQSLLLSFIRVALDQLQQENK
jgi:hypothetical protein